MLCILLICDTQYGEMREYLVIYEGGSLKYDEMPKILLYMSQW
jgi:hypothetical protein